MQIMSYPFRVKHGRWWWEQMDLWIDDEKTVLGIAYCQQK
jgi:hypothetical protein